MAKPDKAQLDLFVTRFCKACKQLRRADQFGVRKTCLPCGAEQQRRYRKRFPTKRKEHYEKNKVRVLAKSAAYRALHKKEEQYHRAAHYRRNKDKVTEVTKAYRLAHLDLYAEAAGKRRATKRKAFVAWANRERIAVIYAEAARLTAETGIRYEVDHIVPLQGRNVCGLHCEANLQIITQAENRSKSFKWAA